MKSIFLKMGFLLPCLLIVTVVYTQETIISLTNPSFEDHARYAVPPWGWDDCGNKVFPDQSPPDVHPIEGSIFGVKLPANHGDTYLGMVMRESGSWESVSQKLSGTLRADSCYSFSLYLCKSPVYKSRLLERVEEVNFITSLIIRVWGGNTYCEKLELLAESPFVGNINWEKYFFTFQPKNDYSYIILEAYHDKFSNGFVNGNVLFDNASPIIPISCDADLEVRNRLDEWHRRVQEKTFSEVKEQRELETSIIQSGFFIEFKNNGLSSLGKRSVYVLTKAMKPHTNLQLVIDFNGLNEKRATQRKEILLKAFIKEGFPQNKLIIRNKKGGEEENIKWLVDKKHMYIGIQKIY